ncbi:MAG: nucleoside-diphosphate kinase [Bacteroidetes bacterium]|nr:nucleoside-diphosphate kinase [Bacteroidota bacterium]
MLERTIVILKPDALERNLKTNVLHRIALMNVTLVKSRCSRASVNQLSRHYNDLLAEIIAQKAIEAGYKCSISLEALGRQILKWNQEYMLRNDIEVLLFEGENCVSKIKNIIGNTDCSKAAPGTIRGDFGRDVLLQACIEQRGNENIIHASANLVEAMREVEIWFNE